MADPTAVFDKDVGVWDAESEIRPGPGAPPIRLKGVSTNRRIGGGRWLVVDYVADGGFEGHGIYGFDPDRQKYTGIWVDSTRTAISHAQGTWDANTRTMTFVTEVVHDGRTIRYREITETLADGSQIYRNLVASPDGGEFEMIKTVYRRRG
jgi:hypothetical protein